jgi:hypothetical protein
VVGEESSAIGVEEDVDKLEVARWLSVGLFDTERGRA